MPSEEITLDVSHELQSLQITKRPSDGKIVVYARYNKVISGGGSVVVSKCGAVEDMTDVSPFYTEVAFNTKWNEAQAYLETLYPPDV